MAYFAQLDENKVVLQVISVANDELKDENGVEQEAKGIAFCKQLFGEDTEWLQTSFNNKIRGTFASIDYYYDHSVDRFIPPQPYPSWILNTEYVWEAPIPYPTDGNVYLWDEESLSYVLATRPEASDTTGITDL
jgi:hypothetical protein